MAHVLQFKDKRKRERGILEGCSNLHCWEDFRDREDFSLEIQAIRPLAVFGTRSNTALRREGVAWVPDLWSFLKLQEVGFSPYLSFILILSVFRCFDWFEAVRGRLIGPKT